METLISANEHIMKVVQNIELDENGELDPENLFRFLSNLQKEEENAENPKV